MLRRETPLFSSDILKPIGLYLLCSSILVLCIFSFHFQLVFHSPNSRGQKTPAPVSLFLLVILLVRAAQTLV